MIDQINDYTLEQFVDYWLEHKPLTPSVEGLNFVKDTHGVTLFRQYPFQVELFIVKPYSEIVPHVHPDVDSYEVWVSGDIDFMRKNKWYYHPHKNPKIRVKHNNIHGAKTNKIGGSFLSIQKWLNGVQPKFIGDNWLDRKDNTAYGTSKGWV